MNYPHVIDTVCSIAVKAGEEIMKIYEGSDQIGIESKSDNSPLTLADKNANQVINKGLNKLTIKWPIISEENHQVGYSIRSKYDRFWLVDPLDGTKEFIKRNGEFTVNIALMDHGYPVFGVVYVPAFGQLYWANRGDGAYRKVGQEVQRITCSRFDMKDKGLKVVCSRSHINEDTQRYLDHLNDPILVSKGSSLKFLSLAEGYADIYPRLGPTMEWDTGAAQIILEEAGGSVIDYNTHEKLRYNKESLLNPYFIALGGTSYIHF